MPVRNHIRRFRSSHSMTATELSERVFVSPSLVSKWESGDREVSDEHKLALAQLFNVPVSAIFEFEYNPIVDALHRTLDALEAIRTRVDRLEAQRERVAS